MEGEERGTAMILMGIVFVAAIIVFIVFAIASKDNTGGFGIEIFGSYLKGVLSLLK